VNAVKGTSATSALEVQVPVSWSKIACGYLMPVHAFSSMVAMAALTAGSILTVTETSALAVSAAATVACP
jgi:hypothetical protein